MKRSRKSRIQSSFVYLLWTILTYSFSPGSLDTERDKLIKDTHEKDLDRLVEHRQALGKKIRDIAMVERKIDEIPSRSELQQYQLQLVELYEQVCYFVVCMSFTNPGIVRLQLN